MSVFLQSQLYAKVSYFVDIEPFLLTTNQISCFVEPINGRVVIVILTQLNQNARQFFVSVKSIKLGLNLLLHLFFENAIWRCSLPYYCCQFGVLQHRSLSVDDFFCTISHLLSSLKTPPKSFLSITEFFLSCSSNILAKGKCKLTTITTLRVVVGFKCTKEPSQYTTVALGGNNLWLIKNTSPSPKMAIFNSSLICATREKWKY